MKCLRLVCVSVFLVLGACVLVQREMESRRSLLSLDDTAQCRWLVGKTPCRSRNWCQKEIRLAGPPIHTLWTQGARRKTRLARERNQARRDSAGCADRLVNAGRLLRDQSIRRSAAGEGER